MDLALKEILTFPEKPAVVAIDVPIEGPEVTLPGGRACDRLARRLLGPRGSSVMGRVCLQIDNGEEAGLLSVNRGGIGIGAQAWGLRKKLLEVDTLMTPAGQRLVHEVHPEFRSARRMEEGP